jgi:hypothetical protein
MVPNEFKRRLNHHKFELEMKKHIEIAFAMCRGDKKTFIISLLNRSLFTYFLDKYNLRINEKFTIEDISDIRNHLYDIYSSVIDLYFSNAKKKK